MPQTLGLARLVREPSSVPSDLEGLRAQIDHLDHSLLDLIEQRLSACIAIASLKANDASGTPQFRPRPDPATTARPVGRADRPSPQLVTHVWAGLTAPCPQAP